MQTNDKSSLVALGTDGREYLVRAAPARPLPDIFNRRSALGSIVGSLIASITFGKFAEGRPADSDDPLLRLVRKYEAQREVFNDLDNITNDQSDELYDRTLKATMIEINKTQPQATTAAGALAALDHVLSDHDYFGDEQRELYCGTAMLWTLIAAARDYIDRTAEVRS